MKVTGPSSGNPGAPSGASPAVGGADETRGAEGKPGADRAEGPSGAAFAEKLGGAAPAAAPASGAVTPATSALVADIKAGRLTARAAAEKLLDQVVAQQLGADAPAQVRDKLRAALLETLENDPLLAEKLASLDG